MPRYKTTAALSVKGDRVERGKEIELSAEEAAKYDPADLVPVSASPAPAPEPEAPVAVEDMNVAQLKARAAELGLSATGTKADLQERIALHIADSGEITSE